MPDLIIKPQATSGNKVIIQDQAGGAVLTTADSGSDYVGTTKGTIHSTATFPSGHEIKRTLRIEEDIGGSSWGGTSTTMADTGYEIAHVCQLANTQSYLRFDHYSGMQHYSTGRFDVTMRSVSNSTYTAGESITATSYNTCYISASAQYGPATFTLYCGTATPATGAMPMPATKTSWSAGDTLYFRVFYLSSNSSNNFFWIHSNSTCNTSITEIAI